MLQKGGNFLPQHASDYIKTLITQRKAVDKNFSVQVMCDDLNLPKSTIDKFLSKQTTDTGWSNVSAMVVYLDGSLDELAGIQKKAMNETVQQIMAETSRPAPAPVAPVSAPPGETLSVSLLMDSHRQEIQRITEQNNSQLDRFRRLIDQGREALIAQHTAETLHMKLLCDQAIAKSDELRKAFEEGRNAWRRLSVVALILLVAVVVYGVWEFSNLTSGLTGYLLRQAGIIGLAGGVI